MHVVRERLVEEIFGEFRLPLIELKRALYDRNFKEANLIAQTIYAEMFRA